MSGYLIKHDFRWVMILFALGLCCGGPPAQETAGDNAEGQPCCSRDMNKRKAHQERCQTAPSARCGPHVPDVKECGDEMAHRLTKAAEAMAAIPSSRPVKPSVSDVVALIDT